MCACLFLCGVPCASVCVLHCVCVTACLCMCVCVCVYSATVSLLVYMLMYARVCLCVRAWVCMCTCVCALAFLQVCTHVRVYACPRACSANQPGTSVCRHTPGIGPMQAACRITCLLYVGCCAACLQSPCSFPSDQTQASPVTWRFVGEKAACTDGGVGAAASEVSAGERSRHPRLSSQASPELPSGLDTLHDPSDLSNETRTLSLLNPIQRLSFY